MLTIGELAKHYKNDEQAVRRAFKVMVKLNKLKLEQDYFKRNYKDDKHFTYEIDQDKFDKHYKGLSERLEPPSDIEPDIKSEAIDIKTDIKNPEADIKSNEPVISSDIKDRYIASLETQMDRKDQQIEHLQESVKLKDNLVIALNNQLLRLAEPKSGIRYERVDEQAEERVVVNDYD